MDIPLQPQPQPQQPQQPNTPDLEFQIFRDWLYLVNLGCEIKFVKDTAPFSIRIVLVRPGRRAIIGRLKLPIEKNLAETLADFRRVYNVLP